MSAIFGAVRRVGRFQAHEYNLFVRLTDRGRHRGGGLATYQAWAWTGEPRDSLTCFDVFLGQHLSVEQSHDAAKADTSRISFDAEIFNRKELMVELRSLTGETPANDRQLLISLYRAAGPAGFARINGSWAIAIVD